MPVTHHDRQLEFHMLRQTLDGAITEVKRRLEKEQHMSCEMLASFIGQYIFGYERVTPDSVTVSEDGQFDATVYFTEA